MMCCNGGTDVNFLRLSWSRLTVNLLHLKVNVNIKESSLWHVKSVFGGSGWGRGNGGGVWRGNASTRT